MKKRLSSVLRLLAFCLLCIIMIAASAVTAFATETNETENITKEMEATPTASGNCTSSVKWEFYEDTGTLIISSSGDGFIYSYSYGSAPWYKYRSKITKVVVTDEITVISNGLFYGLSELKEITLPFVGRSRSESDYAATFGYIFGYTTENDTSNWGVKNKSTEFVNRRCGTGSGIWQYSCNDYYYSIYDKETCNYRAYCLQSYYYYIPESLTKVTITDATKISTAAFKNCSNITEINLNDEITSIGSYAFNNCKKLDTVKLPQNLTSMGSYIMYNNDSLVSIEIPSNIKNISNYAFYNCDNLTEVKFSDNITSIGAYAFYHCNSLKNVDLPENLITISDYAFEHCASFTKVVIPENVQTIGTGAFGGCSNVETITIGKSVTHIYSYAFSGLTKVQEITVPNSVQYIYEGAFYNCSSLKEITLPFVGRSRGASVYEATFGYIFGYATENDTSNWGVTKKSTEFVNRRYGTGSGIWQYSCNDYYYSLYDKETCNYRAYCLQSYYYYIPESLTRVIITDATKIRTAAFLNCANITELILNDGITSIDDMAFTGLGMITESTNDIVISGDILLKYKGMETSIVLPENIRMIAPRAFYGNTALTSVVLADTTDYIGAYAFYNCENAIINVPRISGTLSIDSFGFGNTGAVKYLDKFSYTSGNDTYYYTVDENGNAVIVGCTTTSTNITLPITLGGYTVTEVGYKGMANCTSLTGVTIPNNIVKIDQYAFEGCTSLDTVTLPATCVYVGQYAFSGCSSLTTAVISEGVTYIGDYCFKNCTSLQSIVVSDTCTYLGDYAFYNCTSMESATVGITVPSIGKYTFYNCENLTTVVIGVKVESIGDYAFYNTALTRVATPTSLTQIGNYAFASCDALERVVLRPNLLTIGEGTFMGDSALATINWTANINSIGAHAFHGCSSLKSATLPAGVTQIKDYTFADCTSLASVTIKGTLTSIGDKAFYRDSLNSFTFTEGLEHIGADAFAFNTLTDITLPNTLIYIGEQAFNECTTLGSVSMPDSVAYVGAYAFAENAENLTVIIRYNSGAIADGMLYNADVHKVVMENGITEIGDYVFALCHELTEITFPDTLITIGNYAFYDNRMYSELNLPNTVESIGEYAFAREYRFVKINIPDSVKRIGAYAFYRGEANDHIDPELTVHFYYNEGILCDNILDGQDMQHIIVADNIHTVRNNAFSNAPNLTDIILPDTISSFGTDCFLNDNAIVMNVVKGDGVIDDSIYREKLSGVGAVHVWNTDIGNYSFYGNTTVTDVLTTDVQTIGEYAFADNAALNNVSITGNTDIGDYAFSNDVGLLNTTVTGSFNIGDYSFYNCNAMTDFVIDGTIERIGEHAFDGCKSLKAMLLPDTVNYIGSYAFYDCNSMASINIPYGVEKILSHTFYGCASLEGIEVPNSVVAIEDYAFYGCVAATNITLSNQCKSIGEAVFYNCKALTELNIPDSVTSIGAYAFRSCTGITELVFSDNVDTIGACAFYDCNGLLRVELGRKIVELKDRLFYGCVNLEELYIYAPLSYIDELAFYGADFVLVYCGYDDYMINFFDENGIMYELLEDLVWEYVITFVDGNGNVISSASYPLGAMVVVPDDPTKASDNVYRYVFAGWDSAIAPVGENKTYTAVFTPVYIEYTVVFKDHDGSTISSETYHYGDTVVVPFDPTRAAEGTYTYTFAGWDPSVVACNGDATYTATYTAHLSVKVSGSVTSFGSQTDAITIQLIPSGSTNAAYTTTVTGNSASYSISNVASGTYTMKVTKANHLVAEETVTILDANVTKSISLVLGNNGKQFKINSAYLVLSQDINVIYRTTLPDGFVDPRMVFEFNGEEIVVTDYTVDELGRYCYAFPKVNPQKMGDNISATLYATVNGVEVNVSVPNYSVRQYCINQLGKNPDANLKRMISDLLVYGEKTQIYQNYKTDALVTDGLELTPSTFETLDASYNKLQLIGTADANIKYSSASLELSNDMIVLLGITTADPTPYTFEVTTNGETKVYSAEDLTHRNGKYYLSINGVKATKFNDIITAVIKKNGVQVGQTLNYSVNTYIQKNQGTANTVLGELLKAIYNYGESAKLYEQ